jgi:hypothetical protein
VGMRYAPAISRRVFPRRATSLAERGFRADLAMHDAPPPGAAPPPPARPWEGDQRSR